MKINENQAAEHDESTAAIADEMTLVLRRPVDAANKQYTEVKLREPNAGELDQASRARSGVGSLMALISIVAQVPIAVPQGMRSRDLAEADAFFGRFSLPKPDEVDPDAFEDEKVMMLRKPVQLGKGDGVLYEKLELVEPTGREKDKAAREPSDTRAAIALISLVAKVPRLVVERLSQRDYEEACYFLGSCNVVGQKTGATSARS